MAQAPQHFESIHPRQIQVEYDGIVLLGAQHMIRVGAIMHAIDCIPALAKRLGEPACQIQIIFSYEDTHGL
jgi:hypothetical protein